MKKLFTMIVSIALLVCASNFDAVTTVARTNVSSSFAQTGSVRLRFVSRFIRAANRRLRYTIKAKYPQAVGAKDPRVIKLNKALVDLMTKETNDFKKDFKAPAERMGTSGSSYESEYGIRHSGNNIVSIAFYIDTYFEGAAHGNHNYLVFNYDLNAGKRIKLAELFKPNSNYLDLISAFSIKDLTEKLGENSDTDWIKRGAEPTGENYKNWNVTSKGLEIGFDPYQVAPYVVGPQEVLIPYSELKNVINPNGPLARIVK